MLDYTLFGDVRALDLIIAALIFFFALILAKVLTLYFRSSLRDKINKQHMEILTKVIFYGIMAVAILWILPTIGVELSGLLVAGGIFGLAIGFASQSIVANLISGMFLMVERPIKIGDLVEIDEHNGYVEDIRVISTVIRTLDGTSVRIPNEIVFTSSLTNFWDNTVRRINYEIGIRYSDDAEKAIQIINETIDNEPMALKNPPPFAFVDNLGDNSVNIFVRFWAPYSEYFTVKRDTLWKIKLAIEKEGIQIPFPQRVLWYGDSKS